MKGIKSYLSIFNIKEWPLLETLFVAYPIISGWALGPLPMYLIWLLLIDIVALSRYGFHPQMISRKIKVLFWFVMLHKFIWIFVIDNVQPYYFNHWIGIMLTIGSIFIVGPFIDFEKIKKPLFCFAILSALGLVYQIIQLTRGVFISQLVIPPFTSSREIDITQSVDLLRPSSFMSEPAAFCDYLYLPMFILLLNRKYFFVFILACINLLSTSTTGLVISFLMMFIYIFTQKLSTKFKLYVIIASVILGCLLIRTDYFDATMNKAMHTDLSENERTSIGLTILPQLSFADILIGVPYANISDMHRDNKLVVHTFIMDDGTIFVPTFWNMLFIYGIFGLLIYLSIYLEIFKKSRSLLPYLLCIIVRMFSDPTSLGATFFFEICVMYAFIRYENGIQYSYDE